MKQILVTPGGGVHPMLVRYHRNNLAIYVNVVGGLPNGMATTIADAIAESEAESGVVRAELFDFYFVKQLAAGYSICKLVHGSLQSHVRELPAQAELLFAEPPPELIRLPYAGGIAGYIYREGDLYLVVSSMQEADQTVDLLAALSVAVDFNLFECFIYLLVVESFGQISQAYMLRLNPLRISDIGYVMIDTSRMLESILFLAGTFQP